MIGEQTHTASEPYNAFMKLVSFQSDKIRRLILLSYWIIVLFAVPLWWSTTSIIRLPLPEGRVKSIESQQLRFSLDIALERDLYMKHSRDLERCLEQRLRSRQLNDVFSFTVSPGLLASLGHSDFNFMAEKRNSLSRLEGKQVVLGGRPEDYGIHFESLIDTMLGTFDRSIDDQQVVQYAPRFRLAFSLMIEDAAPGQFPLDWDIATVIAAEIQPVLTRMSVLHNFTIESQVQFFAPLAFEPVSIENNEFGLTQEQLTVFVNSAEWTLSSSVSNDPVLHFILFVPSSLRRPLRILDGNGSPLNSTAFLIPQWGSIFIQNPPAVDQARNLLNGHDLGQVFSIFRDQLLALLGVSPLPKSVISTDIISDWQLNALLRRRAYENDMGSKEALRSIIKLVSQIEGMPVGQDVANDIHESLGALDKLYVSTNKYPWLALQHSRDALTSASRAFFNPGMLALLYFPPEHNLAVYTPLLAPVAVPLIVAVIRELYSWRKNRRTTVNSGSKQSS